MQIAKNKKLLISLSSINIFVIISLWYFGRGPTIGVIDPQILIARQAESVAKIYPNGATTAKLQAIAQELKNTTAIYAKKHKLLLLVKNAVWNNNLPDHTDGVWDLVKEE